MAEPVVHVPEDLLSASEDEHATRVALARRNRAEVEALIRGSAARADLLKRGLLPSLGFGVADLMLMQVITGKLKPTTAKEAMEVAKVALEIARRESGEADQSIVIGTPEQRANAIERIATLQAAAQARALVAGQPIGEIPDGEPAVDRDADLDAPLLSPPSSTPRVALARVRTPTKE